MVKVEDGIGEKLATFIFYQSAFISSVIMALIKGWKLALLCLITFPVTLCLVGIAGLVNYNFIDILQSMHTHKHNLYTSNDQTRP